MFPRYWIELPIIKQEKELLVNTYEDFADTSYIKSITSKNHDNNSNNLSDTLQFNFTLNIKSANTYTIEADLYDSEDNYIATIEKNETLSTGIQIVELEAELSIRS